MSLHLPDQRVSDKVKKSVDFYKPTCDYFIQLGISLNNKQDTRNNIDAANGIVDPAKFKDIISPFTASVEEVLPKLPGEIRDIDFITPIKEKNLGEYIELPYKFYVKSENADLMLKLDSDVRQEIYNLLIKEFQRIIEEANLAAEQSGQQATPPDFAKLYQERLQELIDDRTIKDTHLLSLINEETNFESLRYQLFFDWWATEEFYTYREIIGDKVVKSRIDPLAAYPISNNEQFVEDYDAFVWKNVITYDQLLEKQSVLDHITDKEAEKLNAIYRKDGMLLYRTNNTMFSRIDTGNTSIVSGSGDVVFAQSNNDIVEWNVIWKSFTEYKQLTYVDELGNEAKKRVPKDYTLNPLIGDIELTSIWIPEVYHVMRYNSENNGIYTKPTKLIVQRYDENTNKVKLPIGGKKGLLLNNALNPVPKRIIPFMIVDKLLLLIVEREITKYLPYIKVIPQSIINPDSSGTTKQKMSMLKADNTLIYDDTQVDLNTVLQGLRVINNSGLAEYINILWQIRASNKQDAWDAANMNSERFGSTQSQQTVTNANQNIYRAKLGSTLMITMFNKALELDHKADLEYSKYAYANGKKGVFFDKKQGIFVDIEIDPFEHINSDYFPIVVNSKVEEDKLRKFEELAFSAAQNGDLDIASEAIDADSAPQIKKIIKDILEAKRAYENSIATRKEEIMLQTENAITQREAMLIEAEQRRTDSINEANIEAKYIDFDIAKYKTDAQEKGENNEEVTNPTNELSPIDKSKLRIAERKQRLEEDKFAHQKVMDDKNYLLDVKKVNKPNSPKK